MGRFTRRALLAALALGALPALAKEGSRPSRPAIKGCAWEKAANPSLGFEAWVQRCDFGFRKIDLFLEKNSLVIRWSDGGPTPSPLIDVLDLDPGETPEAGIRRLFDERTEKSLAVRCILTQYREGKPPKGVQRYTFVPNNAFQKELDKTTNPDEVPDPPCGEFGEAPDGIQYFEAQPASGARKVLFVRVGQDEPLFDEKTLKLSPPR